MKVQAKELYQEIGPLSPKAVSDKLHQLADSIAGQQEIKLGHCYEILARTFGYHSKNHMPRSEVVPVSYIGYCVHSEKMVMGSKVQLGPNTWFIHEDGEGDVDTKVLAECRGVAVMYSDGTVGLHHAMNRKDRFAFDKAMYIDKFKEKGSAVVNSIKSAHTFLELDRIVRKIEGVSAERGREWTPKLAQNAFKSLIALAKGEINDIGPDKIYKSLDEWFTDWFPDLHWGPKVKKDIEWIQSQIEYPGVNKAIGEMFKKEGRPHVNLDVYFEME